MQQSFMSDVAVSWCVTHSQVRSELQQPARVECGGLT